MAMNCSDTVPTAKDLLKSLSTVGLGLVISTGISTLLTLVLSAITLVCVRRHVQQKEERYMSWWLVALCPVVGMTSFIGILFPRSTQIDEFVAAIYLSLSSAVFFRLMLLYHGGQDNLLKSLNGVKLPMSKPPFCCCFCLRNVYFNRRTFRRIKIMVYQMTVVRPILLYIGAVINSEETVSDLTFARNPMKAVVGAVNMISTFLALMGLIVTFRLSIKPLKARGIVQKFLYVKLIMFLSDPQGMILELIVTGGLLPCSELFDHPARADTLKFVLLCFEMLLVAVLGFRQFGRKTSIKGEDVKSSGKANEAAEMGSSTVI